MDTETKLMFDELMKLAEENPEKKLEELTEMLGTDFTVTAVPQE
jgi:hypothetical protein